MIRITKRTTAAPLLLLFFLTGCGPNLFTFTTDTTGTGNWFISGSYSPKLTSSGGISLYLFGGALTNIDGQVTGVLHANTSCFGNGATDIPYSGTVDTKRNLSIRSSPVNGQVLSLSGILSADGSVLNNANFSIIGGCSGDIVSGTFNEGPGALAQTQATRIGSLTRTWTPVQSSNLPFTETLIQSPTPDVHGDYALAGTVTVQGSPCFTQGTLQPSSFISGNLGYESLLMNDGSVIKGSLIAGIPIVDGGSTLTSPLPVTQLTVAGIVTGGKCDGSVTISIQ
jgi:hypothetical protein